MFRIWCRGAGWRGVPLAAAAVGVLLLGLSGETGRAHPGEDMKDLDKLLDELYQYGLKNNMWNVRPGDGRFLQVMVGATGAKRVLELGTSNGYSGIWICRALRETGGKLLTIEIDEKRAAAAKVNFERAGVSGLVEVKVGDAAKVLPTLTGPFDVVFLDTEKGDYLAQYKAALPLLRPGGMLLAHNVILMRDEMKDFLKDLDTNPALVTAIAQTSDDGFSVSYKKR
jgi:predicted O-methyltransferase YrrM